MLELEIQNCKRREDLCITIVDWFSKDYLLDYDLEIIVEHKNLKEDQVYGYCDISPYEECTENPRSFLIEMEKTLKIDDYIKVLIHELYHVFQFCRGDLKIKQSKRHWKGIVIEDLDYVNQPHEIEAEEQELILYEHFMTYLDET
jgi:predicted metallopeptidase